MISNGLQDNGGPTKTSGLRSDIMKLIFGIATLAVSLPSTCIAQILSFPGSLPGPSSTANGWGIREIRGLPQAENIQDAFNKAASGTGTIVEGSLRILDVADPQTNAEGGPTLATPPLAYLTNTGADDNGIITIAKARVSVPAAGMYSVQVRSDDGFALRMVGQTFSSVNGAGGVDPLDPSTIYFFGGTSDANTRGVITLAAGIYDVEFLHWEAEGGAFYEVTTGTGASPHTWLPMGAGGSTPFVPNVVRLNAPATVTTVPENPGGGTTANSIAEARTLIAAGKAGGSARTGNAHVLRVGDAQPVALPTGTPADEFASEATGSFQVGDSNGVSGETLTFGLFSDDGHQLRILGQDFAGVGGDVRTALVDVGGDLSLTADFFTGNTNALGLITLSEGVYNFESIHYEGGFEADFEVWYAIGDKTATGFDSSFVPVSTDSEGIEANQGWLVVFDPAVSITGPAPGMIFTPGDAVPMTAVTTAIGVVQVEFFIDGVGIGTVTGTPASMSWVATAGVHVVRVVAMDSLGERATSRGRLLFIREPVVPLDASWRYLNGGDLGSAWRHPNFNDGTFSQGNAQLGFGDGDEVTVINGGTSGNQRTTTYFRHRFTLGAPTGNYALIQLLRDDGAVVYLNDSEVARSNMPSAPAVIIHNTPASSNIGALRGFGENFFHPFQVPVSLLVAGQNVLAVEVHQSGSTSDFDLSFGMAFYTFAFVPDALVSSIDNEKVTLRWPDYLEDWMLEESTGLAIWAPVLTAPVFSGGFVSVTRPVPARGFFRLRQQAP